MKKLSPGLTALLAILRESDQISTFDVMKRLAVSRQVANVYLYRFSSKGYIEFTSSQRGNRCWKVLKENLPKLA